MHLKFHQETQKLQKFSTFSNCCCWLVVQLLSRGELFFRYRHAGEVPIRGGITNTPAHFAPNRYGGRVLNTAHGTAGFSTLLHFLLTALCYQSLPSSSRQAFAYFLSLLSLTLQPEKRIEPIQLHCPSCAGVRPAFSSGWMPCIMIRWLWMGSPSSPRSRFQRYDRASWVA